MFDKVDMQKPKHLLAIIGTFFIFAALPLTVYLVTTSQERAKEGPQAVGPLKGDFETSDFVTGLNQPTSMAFAPDGRLFVTEKGGGDGIGKVRVIKDGNLLATPFLSVSVNYELERGLVGISFDPDFETNKYVYIHYTRSSPIKGRVSRFTASAKNPDVAQSGSEFILLDNIPSPDGGRHQGGAIHFGNDGKLYIGSGDGGFGSANYENAQRLTSLKGKILRINKDGTIPADNPFVGILNLRGEIWAYGFRNPFTFAVDPEDGRIYANDVGQNTWEEINKIEKGKNYGWAPCEGPFEIGVERVTGACSNENFTFPIYWYNHSVGIAVTGAAFYRGNQFPSEYDGRYFFGDYGSGFIKTLDANDAVSDFTTDIQNPVDIQVGPDGALYILSFSFSPEPLGFVKKIQFAPPNAIATVDEVIGPISVTRSFSGSDSRDINKLKLTYSWDFGDGTIGFGKKASHTYDAYGFFDAKLTVTNSHGATSDSEPLRIIVAKCADVIGSEGVDGPLDGAVNGFDIGALVQAFGSTSSSPDWNEAYDLDDSGSVNGFDIGFVVAQFGLLCSV